jgi:hypothetical protein
MVNTSSIARQTGLLLGLALALAVLLLGRVPEGSAQVPAQLSLIAEPSIQLGVAPVGREILSRASVAPGSEPTSGLVEVSNLTGASLDARPRLRTAEGGLDDVVHVAVLAGGARLYDGTLRGLRSGTRAVLRLRPQATRRVRFRVWLPRDAARAVQGRSIELKLDWRSRMVGR